MNSVDVLEHDNFKELRASDPSTVRTVGIITNHTGFDVEGRRTIDILVEAPGIRLTAIFSPEPGITGELDVDSVGNSVDRTTGVPVYSIDGETVVSRRPPESVLKKLNVLVVDIQDIGSRFYTYESRSGRSTYLRRVLSRVGKGLVKNSNDLERHDVVDGNLHRCSN